MLLSKTEALILQLMSENGFKEVYGLELLRLSDGGLKRGTVYITLQRMEDKGFVISRQEEKPHDVSGIPRRLYEITGVGVQALHNRESGLKIFISRITLNVRIRLSLDYISALHLTSFYNHALIAAM